MELSGSDILVIASVGIIGIVFALWRLLYISNKSDEDWFLTDGAVLLVSDGLVHQLSVEAADLFGKCEQTPIVKVLESFLRADSAEARDAVNRLEMTGDPVKMLVYDRNDRAFELIGAPVGGMIRLIIRDAGFLDTRLKAAEERLSAADALVQDRNWERVTLRSLVTEAPIIAWNRSADGMVNWTEGQIQTRNSTVTAGQAVDLIVARTRMNTQPSLVGEPQKSRIEIVVDDGVDTISLQVIEVVRPNGDRIGFATDAGTAASAERTLTRFVQTMTETFAHLTVGLAIFDRNQTLALFNPALVQLWQLEPAWLARRPSLRDIVDELRSSRRLPELQDFHKWRSELLSLFENTEAADYEELWHLSNGSNIRVLARPHPHGSLAFIFDDVTERMRLEQRYRHSIDLRRVTLDRLNEGIAVFGSNGLLQFINQAFHEVWGTNSETVYAAMHVRQFIPLCQELSQDHDVWKRLHSFVTGEEHRREWEESVTTVAGYVLNARFAPLPDGSTMAVFTNITDSKRVSVRYAQKSMNLRFALAVRDHAVREIDSSIRAPLGELGTRLAAVKDDAESQALSQAIDDAVSSIDDVYSLVTLTEAESSKQEVGAVLQKTAVLLKGPANSAAVELRLELAPDERRVECEALPFHKLSFALGLFAIENSNSGSTVALGMTPEADGFSLTVNIQGDAGTETSHGSPTQDRLLLEHLVAEQGGILSVSETKASGAVTITAVFNASRPATISSIQDDTTSAMTPDDRSNVLVLPAAGKRE